MVFQSIAFAVAGRTVKRAAPTIPDEQHILSTGTDGSGRAAKKEFISSF